MGWYRIKEYRGRESLLLLPLLRGGWVGEPGGNTKANSGAGKEEGGSWHC